MSTSSEFKRYDRNRRQASIETDFSMGMMFHSGALDSGYVKTLVNYDISSHSSSLVPRPGLRTSEILLPNIVQEYGSDSALPEYHSDENILIKAAKECIETDGKTYRQIILGKADSTGKAGTIYVVTSEKAEVLLTNEATSDYGLDYEIKVAIANAEVTGKSCRFFTTELPNIHGMEMIDDVKVATVVGAFAFGNSFYFFNADSKALFKTVFDDTTKKYVFESITVKEVDPSEAVTYGYNMLQGEQAYSFVNRNLTGIMQLTGILPYSTKGTGDTLLMTPRKNEDIYFRCYFKGEIGKKYKFTWEWRNVGDDTWTSIEDLTQATEYEIVAGTGDTVKLQSGTTVLDNLQITFKAPASDIMIRVQAYNSTDYETVEKAMTVGFDFTTETYGTATNVKAEVYDLSEAAGMLAWKNRLVLWGIPKDPTVLFLSDVNEPSYFPYPNNISIYDEPIVACHEYLDSLLVFTTSKIYQVSASEDGTAFNSVLIQSNLNIEPWDRHLIQIVKNMVFFKSGNYYFMIVPKAQSTTGQLTLAPVSTPMVEFFNHFEKNVYDLIKDTFDYEGIFDLVNYYNFLDYEDVHNIYVLEFPDDDNIQGYLHLDILYNTVSRTWKIYTFEAPHFLYPYKHDATQNGTMAATSLNKIYIGNAKVVKTFYGTATFEDKWHRAISFSVEPEKLFYPMRESHFLAGFYDCNSNKYFWIIFDPGTRQELDDGYYYVYDGFAGDALYSGVKYHLYAKLDKVNEVSYRLTGEFSIECINTVTDIEFGSRMLFGYGTDDGLFSDNGLLYDNTFVTPFKFESTQLVVAEGTIFSTSISSEEYTIDTVNSAGNIFTSSSAPFMQLEVVAQGEIYLHIDAEGFYAQYGSDTVFDSETYLKVVSDVSFADAKAVSGRCIQLFKYDSLNLTDLYVPESSLLAYSQESSNYGYNLESIAQSLKDVSEIYKHKSFFKNWQFVDTGYRNDNTHLYKRYRELQFQINNIEGVNLYFGLEFLLNGENRLSYYTYDVEQVLDMNDPDYGLIYIQPQAQSNLPLEYVGTVNETKLGPDTNMWMLNQSLFPDLSFWKIRMPVSGKGIVPRMRLVSRNQVRYELLGINWIYRTMNMR